MTMRVLSLGAGVQSSTLLLMGCRGEERIDAAIFADTQWEPAAVYQHLAWLEQQAQAASISVYRVTAGNLRADMLAGHSPAWGPLHVQNLTGGKGQLKRQCTTNYKLRPIRRQVRALWETAGRPEVEQIIGISLDECHRMRDSDVRYIRNVYPLIDRRMTRQDCLRWLAAHGYPEPAKSACIGCPYHGDNDWRRFRDHDPVSWADAVDFDASIRDLGKRIDGGVYLHRSLRPLSDVDLRTPQERGQADLFGEECWGGCVVFNAWASWACAASS